jgi:nicotinamide-nucleotide amidase
MAEGALRVSACGLSLAVTGIAGPGGGTPAKPVGLVHLATATSTITLHVSHIFPGDREAIRLASLETALRMGVEIV